MKIQHLLNNYSEGSFSPATYEEFFTEGKLDVVYFSKTQDVNLSRQEANNLMNKSFGKVIFDNQVNSNEVSEELFEEHYIFGKFANVRGWIGYMWEETGLVLTREALYGYILKGDKVS